MAIWPFPKKKKKKISVRHTCTSLKKEGKEAVHQAERKKNGESGDFSFFFHTKIVIHEDLTVQTQIRFRKHDLRSSIYVSTNWFEVFSLNSYFGDIG
jgi:hypothetical protein